MSSNSTPSNNQFKPINPIAVLSEHLTSPLPGNISCTRTLSDASNSFVSCRSPSFTASNTSTTPPSFDHNENDAVAYHETAPTPSPTIFATLEQEENETKKTNAAANKGGREKGAMAYSADEHVALLTIVSSVKGAFNVSESSPLWASVYKQMCDGFYSTTCQRLSSALHGHFVELYSSFKLGIHNLSLLDKVKKCPATFDKGDDAVNEYAVSLLNLFTSDTKKYKSKKWWRLDVVELLLKLHLEYIAEFGSEKQSANWIAEKAVEHKNKFEMDQRNREAELARKRAAEEDERRDAAKQRKAVAESSVELVAAFKQLVQTPKTNAVDEKIASLRLEMSTIKTDIMQEIENKNREVKDTLSSILDVVRGLADKSK